MVATNTPADLLYSSFEEIVDALRQLLADFSPAEREAMLSGTATRIYRI
jgi:predicted TIM-barrel fold metal-dependent hydrolase